MESILVKMPVIGMTAPGRKLPYEKQELTSMLEYLTKRTRVIYTCYVPQAHKVRA